MSTTSFFHSFGVRCLVLILATAFFFPLFPSQGYGQESDTHNSPPMVNPHASPPGPNTPMPSGIVGIAMHITAGRIGDPAQLIIRAVHPSGPAARGGLTHGEAIVSVNGEPVAGKTYQEVVGLIRGEIGSSVKLGLQGPQGERTVSLMRMSEQQLLKETPPSM